jgi:hypothetical protein
MMWDVGCGMWDVGCGMWDVGCGMWDVGGASSRRFLFGWFEKSIAEEHRRETRLLQVRF